MNITQIGTRKDRSLLGEDNEGNFYSGAVKKIGFDELTASVTLNDDGTTTIEYSHAGGLHSKATLHTITPEEYTQWLADCLAAKQSGVELPRPLSGYRAENGLPRSAKQFTPMLVMDAQGNVTETSVERKLDVLVWTAL